MDFEDLKFDRDGAIAIVTMNRPEALNALSPGLRNSLVQAIETVDKDDSIKVMILTGAGRGFCAGADVKKTLAKVGEDRGPVRACKGRKGILGPTSLTVQRLCALEKPVIGAINGVAAGAGLGLALGCDIRIAAEGARFISVFVRRGLVPDTGVTWFLPRVVGMSKALELMWTGDEVSAKDAERLGIVSRVVPPDDLMKASMELANRLASGPSVAIEFTKRLAYAGMHTSLSVQLAHEVYGSWVARGTEDFEEGVKSFMEKRKPVFKGE